MTKMTVKSYIDKKEHSLEENNKTKGNKFYQYL